MPATVIASGSAGSARFGIALGAGDNQAAPGVSAAGPGVAHHVCGGAKLPGALLVSADRVAGRVQARPAAKRMPVLTMVCAYSLAVSDAAAAGVPDTIRRLSGG